MLPHLVASHYSSLESYDYKLCVSYVGMRECVHVCGNCGDARVTHDFAIWTLCDVCGCFMACVCLLACYECPLGRS